MKVRGFLSTTLGLAALALSAAATAATEAKPADPAKSGEMKAREAKADESKRLVRDGLIIDFEAVPVEGKELMEGMLAEVRFRFTDERTGKPVQGVRPGAWMDVGANIQGQAGAEQKECKEKIGLYLKGAVGIRPLADLNGYYLLVLNRDPTITVIDPMVSMAGRTSTLTSIQLKRPPLDWTNYGDAKRLFVTMPSGGKVAVVDTETLKVVQDIDAGKEPSRIVLQPDGRYLWVGNNGREAKDSGVTVIDPQTMKVVKQLTTGKGHHEIAISADNRHAFITNRDEGTVTVVDVGTLEKVKDIKTGSLPLSVAYSKLSGAAYVADGKEGTIAVIDGTKLELVTKIKAKPGLGPLRFTPDGRFAMVVNTAESVVNVIDPASNEIIHSPKVQAEPYQVVYTRDFAYVRGLGSERVTMINLSSLGKGKQPIVQSFAAGTVAPKKGGDLPLADTMTAALGEAAAFVVSPADNATYFYMEGMNAPMSSYQGRGSLGRAV
ncbi:MAG TPA: cytochrome D1 domain-containing protein, partial [Burkholderiales bacterium]